ncbi:MAG: class I SAM-dependent methyltransferase [Fibrobacterota bacterium]|nr:class I SAM-dependent methyltransferase [Fibrobacterota bacterium]
MTERILLRYPHASSFQRWHMRGRLRLCPYAKLNRHLTGAESILDVGCGFGHLAWHLADSKPGLRYFGTDIDDKKISLAKGSVTPESPAHPEFLIGDAPALNRLPKRFGNIVFLDVLYLMPWEAQKRMLEWAFGRLAPGDESVVVVKTMDRAEGISGFRAVVEEWIMVRLLRRTVSSGTINGARSVSDYLEFAHGLGFRGETESLATFNPSTILRFHR